MAFDWNEIFNQDKALTEPSAGLRAMAMSNWECYQAHLQEGFTSEQAMQIVLLIVQTALIHNFNNPLED